MLTNENYNHNNKNEYDAQQDQFDNWCDKWDAAQSAGIFDDVSAPHVPSMDLSKHSFFGPIDSHSSDGASDEDAAYWNQVHDLATGKGPSPMEVFSEEAMKRPATEIIADKPKVTPASGWSKAETTASQKVSKQVGTAANPIYSNTVGKDQDLKPAQMDATFSERDIEELGLMKIKLYTLETRLNTAEDNSDGGGGSKYKTQIESLKNQIDELSDRMTRTHPDQAAP